MAHTPSPRLLLSSTGELVLRNIINLRETSHCCLPAELLYFFGLLLVYKITIILIYRRTTMYVHMYSSLATKLPQLQLCNLQAIEVILLYHRTCQITAEKGNDSQETFPF
jgi:hypothetical protein